ncbi:MAG: helix-turn-helix domain-containing protein [Candidatus Omnitrophica bacterium]|nr:helix-turn-helix domain-containing protein [Candidatus Omnitrophota bacterium]
MTDKPNLSIEDVARWLGVDRKTVYSLARQGKLPGFKVGNQWRFNQEMLRAWITESVTAEWFKVGAVKPSHEGEHGKPQHTD